VRAGISVGMALLSPLQGGAPESVIAAAATAPPVQAKPDSAPPPLDSMRSGAVMEALERHSARTGGAPSRWVPRPLPPPQQSPERPLLSRLRLGASAARARMTAAFRRDDGSDDSDDAARSDAAPLLTAADTTAGAAASAGATLDAVFERMERGRGRR
jgi:hypothetical protein